MTDERQLLKDLRKLFQERLTHTISDHITLTEVAGIDSKLALARLIQDLVHVTGYLAASTCNITPEEFGQLCTEQLSATKFRFADKPDAK